MTCNFATTGFSLPGTPTDFKPCGTAYHPTCIKVGAPFTTRLPNNAGLTFPAVRHWPTFVCEACTVRAVLHRELRGSRDKQLLVFERMRLIDTAHTWAVSTHIQYQSKLNYLHQFEHYYEVAIIRGNSVPHPPNGPDIPLMWAQEAFSLRPGNSRRTTDGTVCVTYGTVRQLRSALSQLLAWDAMLSKPGSYLDRGRRLLHQDVRPTDSLAMTMFSTGLQNRLGDHPLPSKILLDRHIWRLDCQLNHLYRSAISNAARIQIAQAGFANLLLWLGWLRSSELFTLTWADVHCYHPSASLILDLPPNNGALLLQLLPQTKTTRSRRADVIIAYTTNSGLSPGTWFQRLRSLSPRCPPTQLLFQPSGAGPPWTSSLYRTTYLYPFLHLQKAEGDPYLQPIPTDPSNSLADLFWSCHSYRRGANSHCRRGGLARRTLQVNSPGPPHRFRKATEHMQYHHGRWRMQRRHENLPTQYTEWTFAQRLAITRDCF